jgi:hypothetical protein
MERYVSKIFETLYLSRLELGQGVRFPWGVRNVSNPQDCEAR